MDPRDRRHIKVCVETGHILRLLFLYIWLKWVNISGKRVEADILSPLDLSELGPQILQPLSVVALATLRATRTVHTTDLLAILTLLRSLRLAVLDRHIIVRFEAEEFAQTRLAV